MLDQSLSWGIGWGGLRLCSSPQGSGSGDKRGLHWLKQGRFSPVFSMDGCQGSAHHELPDTTGDWGFLFCARGLDAEDAEPVQG